MTNPSSILVLNGALLLLVGSLVGVVMLIPLQPWAPAWARRLPAAALRSTHLDWILLGLMQFAAAFGIAHFGGPQASWPAWLLVYGGWLNATPYLLRGIGIDAFVLAPPLARLLAALVAGSSVTAILVGWSALLVSWSGTFWP